MSQLEFRVLGPVEVARDGDVVDLGPRKQRLVLSTLLVAAPEIVGAEALLDRVWGERPPRSASHALQVYVSNLRRLLEPDRETRGSGGVLVTRDPGYGLVVSDDGSDARRFETMVDRATGHSNPQRTVDLLDAALELWRGPALADVADQWWAVHEAARLDGLRLTAMERRFDAALVCGHHDAVVHELESVVHQHPLRERFWEQLIVALYRCGRQVDALRAYDQVRRHLADDLGLHPGPDLVALEAAVLRHEPDLAWSPPGVAQAAAPLAVHAGTSGDEPGGTGPPGPPAEFHGPTHTTTPADLGGPDPGGVGDGPTPGTGADRASSGPGQGSVTEDQRRVVTALFADLVGSTPLGEALSADEFKLVVDDAMARMVSACERFGGQVVNVAGDGLTALFGAPVAHEDDAERAVLAGLELVDAVASYGAEVAAGWGVEPLAARVGVNTGPVVTGMAGAGGHVGFTAIGDAVNTAARLESAARPGTVLVGSSTRDQLGPTFSWSPPQRLDLKGKADPVEAFEATGGRPGGGRPRGIPDRPTPLLSRDAELQVAQGAVDEVLAGRGGVLMVNGPAGLGKSRLLAEVRSTSVDRSDPRRPLLWLHGTCLSYGAGRGLWPVRQIIAAWIDAPVDQAELRIRVNLRSRIDELYAQEPDAASDAYGAMAALLGIDDTPPDERAGASEPHRASLHDRVCEVFARIARDRPVVVAVDDLHWADDEVLRLLQCLAAHTEHSALLLVLAARAEPGHGSWELREHIRRELPHRTTDLTLQGLDREGMTSLLEELTGGGDLPGNVRDELLELCAGNPFYLEELVRTLLADGVLVTDRSGGLRYEGGRVRLPDTVEQVVVSRLDRLDPAVRSVVTAASVLGREFDRSLLEDLVDVPPEGTELDEGLVELQRLGLLREVSRWPEPTFGFEHALIREAAYDTLVRARRQELHRRAAEALDRRGDTEATMAEIGHHWQHAGDDERALDCYQRAGEVAEKRGTLITAADLYAAALDAARRLGNDRVQPDGLARLLVARWAAGHSVDSAGAMEGLDEAVELARAAGDTATEARALETLAVYGVRGDIGRDRRDIYLDALDAARRADDTVILARALGRLAIDDANALNLAEAHRYSLEAMAAVDQADPDARVFALDGRKLVALYLGELDVLAAVLDELEPILERPQFGWLRRYAMSEAAVLDLAVGALDTAEAKAVQALELSGQVSGTTDRESFLAVISRVQRARGDYGAALASGREACELALASRNWWVPWAAAEMGALLLELGRDREAVACLRRGIGCEPSMPSQEIRCAGLLALAGCRAGDTDAERTGHAVAAELLDRMTSPDAMTYLYGADGMLGSAEAQVARGDTGAPVDLARTVADAAETAGWLEPASWAHHVLGFAAWRQGDAPEAAAYLRRAVEHANGVLPGRAWRSLAALGHVAGDGAARSEAEGIVEQLAGPLDEAEAEAFQQRAAATIDAGFETGVNR